MSKEVVLVLGMHRSGTSVLTQVMSKLGYYLGAGQLGASEHNEEGHFERKDVIALDEAVLRFFGMEWFSFGEKLPDISMLDDTFTQRAEQILDDLLSQSDRVVIKEPRMCITLPLWQKAMEKKGVAVRYVFIFRHPKSVALSLKKRNNISIEDGQALWLFYNQALLRYINQDIFAVNYDELVNHPETALKGLAKFLKLKQTDIGDTIKKTMRHHLTPIEFSKKEAVLSTYYQDFLKSFSGSVPLLKIKAQLAQNSDAVRYLKNREPLKWHTQMFFNHTKAYTEKDSVQTVVPAGERRLSFDLTPYGKIYSLRFDPHMVRCRLILGDVTIVDMHDRTVKFKIKTNASTVNENIFVFNSDDPQVEFILRPRKLKSVTLMFEILDQ